jgi:hypothetical protein
VRKGEELKAPHYASAATIRDYIPHVILFPTLATLLLWLLSVYKYRSTSITDINPSHLLLLL